MLSEPLDVIAGSKRISDRRYEAEVSAHGGGKVRMRAGADDGSVPPPPERVS
ncbi:MAG: hypothetical protein R3D27_02285 [Hyphomicrobiaceae bacterium]